VKDVTKVFEDSEKEIIEHLINMAQKGEYTRYVSIDMKDWLVSIRETTRGIINLLKNGKGTLHVDESYMGDESTAFSLREARLHRARGVPLAMFLGMAKLYRQAFLAVMGETSRLKPAEKKHVQNKINLYFDRFEVGVCSAWEKSTDDQRVYELQEVNRLLTNETCRLRSADKTKNDYLKNISHVIRTPVKVILGFVETLLKQNLSQEQRENVKAINLCGSQLLELINNIQDLLKIEAGEMVLEEAVFNIEDVLKDVITKVRQKAKEKDLDIEVVFQKNAPRTFIGDPARIKQVIFNLIFNMIGLARKDTVTISTSNGNREGSEGVVPYLFFDVTNTGIGINPDKLKLFFEAFTQIEASTVREFEGNWLGLTICRSAVELIGGMIWVKGNESRGLTILLSIPVKIFNDKACLSRDLQ
jgi:signal transduction histidine kinase